MKKIRERILCVFLTAIIMLSGCGTKVNYKSPESAVKSLISAYQNQDEESAKECFGIDPDKKCAEEIQTEITYNLHYFEAHEAERIGFKKVESLGKFDKYELVYAWYEYEIKGKKETQKVPAMSFYFVKEKDKKHYVVPAKDVTDEMSETSREEYKEFTKTENYKKYDKEYQTFVRKNPKYENSLQNKFKEVSR